MRQRRSSLLGIAILTVLLALGCEKEKAVRAPTRVLTEGGGQAVVVVPQPASHKESLAPEKKEPAAPPAPAFQFPADRGGELLIRELTPTATKPLEEPTRVPQSRRVPARVESPEVPLPPTITAPVVLPRSRPGKNVLPRMVTPEAPVSVIVEYFPEPQPMVFGPRTKETGINVTKPTPLPPLGEQLADRASLADATIEASHALVLAAPMPARQRPVPFERVALPDLNKNYRALRLPLPPESTEPVAGPPRTP